MRVLARAVVAFSALTDCLLIAATLLIGAWLSAVSDSVACFLALAAATVVAGLMSGYFYLMSRGAQLDFVLRSAVILLPPLLVLIPALAVTVPFLLIYV